VKTIHKYPLPVGDLPTITMPKGAEILCAKTQGGEDITLWAIVETNADFELRRFCVVGTGKEVPSIDNGRRSLSAGVKLKFIDTVLLCGGKLVFHVFEVVAA
jgi:hypothetical protein